VPVATLVRVNLATGGEPDELARTGEERPSVAEMMAPTAGTPARMVGEEAAVVMGTG